ncbi:S-ribosylhomocysteine lyase protein [Salinisphaera shabanensis E1L3A]|uniref:S-ribosylhomocysteine lyase protein n=1 Tax=Salinisphaera shabanensis E1L3A TaxID=1033802 RepID=U2E8T4_9GAMM|nr:DUF1116 domain-containing protein [Salinisphaera shabanensis]ERJ20111.1 S-ribosylhomocysteine lyase protein [Salinisphaera shabanensis E1L3A]
MSAVVANRLEAKRAQMAALFEGARLRGVARLGDVRPALGDDVLLHAGPPLDTRALSYPLRNAAIHALVYAGRTADEAAEAIDAGAVQLAPAQDHGVVTPLAQVVSTAMPVFQVGDDGHDMLAPIAESAPPALRFGSADDICVSHLRQQAEWAFDVLAPRLAAVPLPVCDWIDVSLVAGDECHARTAVANDRLLFVLNDLPHDYRESIAANANFVLPILMAASAWAMHKHGGSIASVGGNGRCFGVRFAGEKAWRTTGAGAPTGVRMTDCEQIPVLGAVGDSPVIDFCGLGGQALTFAPALVDAWHELLPTDADTRAEAVCDAATGLVCRHRIAASGRVPLVHLAMVADTPDGGLAGRGFYAPDLALFGG